MRGVSLLTARDTVKVAVCVVGGGPAGLAAAIRCKQLAPQSSVLVLDRGLEIGSQVLSGSLVEPRALDELLPQWKTLDPPKNELAPRSEIMLLEAGSAYRVPETLVPGYIRNSHSLVFGLSDLVVWLCAQAQSLGVEVLPGFSVTDLLINSRGCVTGVITAAAGKSKDVFQDKGFQPSFDIQADQTIVAEGTRGLLAEGIIKKFKLRDVFDAERIPAEQTYGLGLKETWSVPSLHPPTSLFTFQWPLSNDTFGYGFLLTRAPHRLELAFVVGLDYKNPHFDPHSAFQQWKTHPEIRKYIHGGQCTGFGAKALTLGGLYSLPKLSFPGGVLAGCSAGFFNPARGQGIHTAMKSGMLAAEAISLLGANPKPGVEAVKYNDLVRRSWIWDELHEARNFRQGFFSSTSWGLAQAYLSATVFRGKRRGFVVQPKGFACLDSERTQWADKCEKIPYPSADGVLSFTKEHSHRLTGSVVTPGSHRLIEIRKEKAKEAVLSLRDFGGMEANLCPTGVFTVRGSGDLETDARKCVMCKACEIKAPGEYLKVTNADGGEGPN